MKGSTVLLVVGGAAAVGLGVLLFSKSASAQPQSVTLKAGCRYRGIWEIKPALATSNLQTVLTAMNSGGIPGLESVDASSTEQSTEVIMVGVAGTTHTLFPGTTSVSLAGKTMTLKSAALLGCP